jgi:hypothetical protein
LKSADFRMRTLLGKEKLLGVPDDSFVTDGELVAALRAAAGENGAAVLGFHADAESVSLCPFAVVRLKCSFWHVPGFDSGQANRFALPSMRNLQYKGSPIGCQFRSAA